MFAKWELIKYSIYVQARTGVPFINNAPLKIGSLSLFLKAYKFSRWT